PPRNPDDRITERYDIDALSVDLARGVSRVDVSGGGRWPHVERRRGGAPAAPDSAIRLPARLAVGAADVRRARRSRLPAVRAQSLSLWLRRALCGGAARITAGHADRVASLASSRAGALSIHTSIASHASQWWQRQSASTHSPKYSRM